jgi:radical SAM-linked protein
MMMMTTTTPQPSTAPINRYLLEQVILPQVFKPGRYLGLEQGTFNKPFESVKATLALTFPDVYEIGASSYAIKLLYSVVNNHPDFLCDRVYAPAEDLRALLKQHNMPLYGVESKRPLSAFDAVAVSLQYELNYTTVLGVLAAAQLPLRAKDRMAADTYPIVLAGGPGTSNPAPMAPFFDGFMLGDGEELLLEVLELLSTAKTEGWSRQQKLEALAQVPGVYVPGFNTHAAKRVVDFANLNVELAPLIPAVEAVHDRVVVEARRGCDRMCRFCHPAFINLPAREQSVEAIKAKALKQLEETGYEECSLLSLSIADYSNFKHLVTEVASTLKGQNASLSLSSQRADRFSVEVAEAVQTVRKSTLTFAPEAGTARLRDVINKNLSDAEIIKAVTTAYKAGWNKVKLYFMIGLPTETKDDLDGIVALVKTLKEECTALARDPQLSNKKHLEVNVTLSNFVPKPHTPFQWHRQDTMAELEMKIGYLKQQFKWMRGVKASFTTPSISKLEAVISKGGEELADVLECAYNKGAYLDAWGETQPFGKWFEALSEHGICPEDYTTLRLIHPDEPLPWDGMSMGLDKAWLRSEWERSIKGASTKPCFEECSLCGVCAEFNVWPSFNESHRSPLTALEATASTLAEADEALHLAKRLAEETLEREASPEAFEGEPRSAVTKLSLAQAPKIVPAQRLRLELSKTGPLRFISHLDWLRLLHRAFKRSGLPVAHTQGFNPSPRLSFSPALPLFVASLQEFVDVELLSTVTLEEAQVALRPYLPAHVVLHGVQQVAVNSPSIESLLQGVQYQAVLSCASEATKGKIKAQVDALRQQPRWDITLDHAKKGSFPLNLAPYISRLTYQEPAQLLGEAFVEQDQAPLCLTVQLRPNATPQQPQVCFEAQQAGLTLPRWAKPRWLLEQALQVPALAGEEPLVPLPWELTRTQLVLTAPVAV